jgi:hypothetical protein
MTTTDLQIAEIERLARELGYTLWRVPETDRPVIDALERTWARIRDDDSEVPAVVFDLQPGPRSSCSSVEWPADRPVLVANLKDRDGTNLAGRDVLEWLLHMASHFGEGRSSTATDGRWHTRGFADAAIALGLEASERPGVGFAPEGLARGTLTRYAAEIAAMDRALKSWNPPVVRKGSRSRLAYVCQCTPPRRFLMHEAVFERGLVRCEVCGQPFELA